MCVDRLEVGLKPACVSACLGKALDFGVIENIPEGRTQAKTEIPGFPTPDITHPNIRFQQTRTTQRDMVRLDSTPLKYHRDDGSGAFRPVLDPKHGFQRRVEPRSKLLGSHENAHIAFTLCVQTAMGAFLLLVLGAGWACTLGGLQGRPPPTCPRCWPDAGADGASACSSSTCTWASRTASTGVSTTSGSRR